MKTKKIAKTIILTLIIIGLITFTGANLMTSFGTIQTHITIQPGDLITNTPPNKTACKDGGYVNYVNLLGDPFSGQGDCVSYVTTQLCKDYEILNLMYPDMNANNQGECISYFNELDKDKSFQTVAFFFQNEQDIDEEDEDNLDKTAGFDEETEESEEDDQTINNDNNKDSENDDSQETSGDDTNE